MLLKIYTVTPRPTNFKDAGHTDNCIIISFPTTVKILKFGTPQTIAIIVLKIEKFDVTLH